MKASDAAYEILAAAGGPLHVKELCQRMLDQELWETAGKTPWDTLSATLGDEINALGAASRFSRPSANTFALRKANDPIPPVAEVVDGPKSWLFQGNPKLYDLLGGIAAGRVHNYAMNQHRDHAAYGDRVFFYLSGEAAGIYAIGRITSTAYRAEAPNEFGLWKVDVAFEGTVEPPLVRPELLSTAELATFAPFSGRMGTNFVIPSNVAARLEPIVAARLVPAPVGRVRQFDPVAYDLDQSIERARQHVKDELLAHLRGLTPGDFEKVVLLLLEALKYEDAVVTGKSGDHGVDVRAVLRYRGVADVPTFVQAKRYGAGNNVDGAVIGRLRGSLPVEAHGVVITTSDFTKQARKEAILSGLKPIALIYGQELIELLIDLGIGVEKREVEVLRLAPERLAEDLAG